MILIYPDKLKDHYKVKMILDHLGYPCTYNTGDAYDVVFNSSQKELHEFDLKTTKTIINGRCNNVLKNNVDSKWEAVTGRGLSVNPMEFKGWCVEKTLKQGTNSGRFVMCPHPPKKDFGYFKWVDTRDENMMLNDYRMVICGGKVILCLIKRKPQDNPFRFSHTGYIKVNEMHYFSTGEINNIVTFTQAIGLDFGEIDVLRSNFDGEVYVIDVNNLAGYGYFRDKEYVKYVSKKFKEAFL